LGGAVVAEEATPKQKADCEGDAQGGNRARHEQPRGVGHRGCEIFYATAKKESANAATITGTIWGAIAKSTGAPRAAPVDVLRV
jgi:hypothetical protein